MRPSGVAARRVQVRQGAALMLACFLVLVGLDRAGILAGADLKLTDLRFRLRGERRVTDLLALVEVDDATIKAYGRWPLPREAYALLIAAAEQGGARAMGLDLLFLSPDPEAPRSDQLLVAMTSLHPNVVHAMAFVPAAPGAGPEESRSPTWQAALERHGIPGLLVRATQAGRVSTPFEDLLAVSGAIAHVSVAVDRDGGVRRVPMVVRHGERLYPALGLRLAGMAAGETGLPELRPARGGFDVLWSGGRRQFIPTDAEGGTAIDFAGDRAAVPQTYSMLAVLKWYRDGDSARLKAAFGGKTLLVGATAINEAVSDVGMTPFATATPLAYIHANAVDSVLRNRFLRSPPEAAYLATLAAISVLLGWLYVVLALPAAAGVMGGVTILLGTVLHLAFVMWGVDARPTLVLLLPALGYATVSSYRFIFLERRTREREREMEMARAIQERLLPVAPPDVPTLDVCGVNVPAQEIGGDYFDWLPLHDESWGFVIGDVSGKGASAALLMSHLHALLHAEVRNSQRPGTVLGSINDSLFRATESHRFATFFMVVIPVEEGPVLFGNAGHNPPILAHRNGDSEFLGPTGVPLGMFEGVEYGEETRSLRGGDCLVLYSDGISECLYRDEMYGEERLENLVARLTHRGASAHEICEAVLGDIRSFCHGGPFSDDVTILVVRRP